MYTGNIVKINLAITYDSGNLFPSVDIEKHLTIIEPSTGINMAIDQ